MKIISIIGSNSFLASYLIEEFLNDENVQLNLFSRKKSDYSGRKANINQFLFDYPTNGVDFNTLLASDVVIYCAASGVQASDLLDVNVTYEVNLFLPIKILNYLSANSFNGKWISFGTYFEIGDNETVYSYTEQDIVSSALPVPNHYCCSKRLFSKFIGCGQFTVKAWHLVLPTIYGSKENKQRLIPYIISSLKQQELPLLSAGEQIRQYVHCLDVVRLLKAIIVDSPACGIYNVTAAETVAIKDIVQVIFSFFGKDAADSLGTRHSRDESMKILQLDSSKIRSKIPGWEPHIRLKEGLQEYL